MKNFTLGLNIFLAVAVAILFYLHFSSKQCTGHGSAALPTNAQPGSFKVAYFEMDSLQSNFEYYKQVAKDLGNSEQQKRSDLATKKNAYIAKVKEYQAKGQSMSQTEMAQAQQDIAQREREYTQEEQAKSQEMQDESFKKLQDVKKKIEDYLKDYNKNKTYSFIIASNADLIYYKDSAYNITNDLIKGLNALYKTK
ncbi:OmpH family outer membrane protein [Parasediminibacterium sp. JCM 36343]|uniref:OmpH family outer membrane protein n=1 Tax=Parasediminibacterium sp. JCM 36343 TaxID=3374279 RepID=UPI00397B3893